MAASPIPVPIFDGENYNDWSKKMKAFLKSQDLWEVVVEGYQEAEMEYQDFEEKNASALRFIQEAVADNCPKVSNSKTAKDAWGIVVTELKRKVESWVIDIKVMAGCVDHAQVKACSISIVPDNLRKVKEEAYSPKVVSIGPFHHGTRSDSDLHLMEETKWRYMRALLRRALTSPEQKRELEMLDNCSKAILRIDPKVRASYGGDIKLKPEELARIMIVDGCFFLEILLTLYDHVTKHEPYPEELDGKTLSDLTMLENQIPFIVLKKLRRRLSEGGAHFPTFTELAKTLFDYHVKANSKADSPFKAFHFLHLMHLSSVYSDNESDTDTTPKEARQQLKRCARKLRASGIKIQAGTPATGNIALNKFVDKFNLNVVFDKYDRTLTIPPLHIKEGTEVKWRNFIAWEQSGIGIGYKFTSYASFFSGLICSIHDIELLRAKKAIIVDDPNIEDEDLLELFTTIVNGVRKMDSRYTKLCKRLNAKTVVYRLAILRPRMWWHYCRRVLAWLRKLFKKWILDFRRDYMPNPWVFMGVLAATALLGLTIAQTYFAARGKV